MAGGLLVRSRASSGWAIRPASYRLWRAKALALPWQAPNVLSVTGVKAAARPPLPISMPLLVKRSEEHTSELQSLMRISYAVFCLKKKKKNRNTHYTKPNYHLIHRLNQQ